MVNDRPSMDTLVLVDFRSRYMFVFTEEEKISYLWIVVFWSILGVFYVIWTFICSLFLVGLTLLRHRFNVESIIDWSILGHAVSIVVVFWSILGVFYVVWTLICNRILVALTLFRHRFNVESIIDSTSIQR